jgi:anti-anti-sigma regulatory factor
VVITRHGEPPGLVLSGHIGECDLENLRAALLDGADADRVDTLVDMRAVPFLLTSTARTLVCAAAELARSGRNLVLWVAPHHEWVIEAIGWADAPGLVMANGGASL